MLVGTPPGAASRVLERYIAVPSKQPRTLLPDGNDRALRGALLQHNRLRPASKRIVRAGLAGVLSVPGLRRKLASTVCVCVDGTEETAPTGTLRETLSERLGREVAFAIGLPPAAPYRKPVLQLISPKGEVFAFAKVAASDLQRQLISTEATALDRLASHPVPGILAPRLLDSFDWAGRFVTVTTALPRGVRRYRPWHEPPLGATRAVAELDPPRTARLAATDLVRDLRTALQVSEDHDAPLAGEVLELVTRSAGDVEVTIGFAHGDWTPWNLALDGSSLCVLDWEHARSGVPLGIDVVNFVFLTHHVEQASMAADTPWSCIPTLTRLVGNVAVADALVRLYLVEQLLRLGSAVERGASPDDRFRSALVRSLEHALKS